MRGRSGISEFVVGDKSGFGSLDVDRIVDLPDSELRERLVEENETYISEHGRNPRCAECRDEISKPDNFIRYFGGNLHNLCFLEVYEFEKNDLRENEKKYFDRIEGLIRGKGK